MEDVGQEGEEMKDGTGTERDRYTRDTLRTGSAKAVIRMTDGMGM